MNSPFRFKITDVDPKESIVSLTISTSDKKQISNIKTLMKITTDPNVHDSPVNAYILSNAIIPEFVLWDIIDLMADKEEELGLRNQIDLDLNNIKLKIFINVVVSGKPISETGKHNFTNLELTIYHSSIYRPMHIEYHKDIKEFLSKVRYCFRQLIYAITHDDTFDYDIRWITDMLPDVKCKVDKFICSHNRQVEFQMKLEERRRLMMEKKIDAEKLSIGGDFETKDLDTYEYVKLREMGEITKRKSVIPDIVNLFKKRVTSVNKISATRMMTMIPQCRHIFDPIAHGELQVAANDGYVSEANLQKFKIFLMETCADTMLEGCSKTPTEAQTNRIVKIVDSCLSMYETAVNNLYQTISSMDPRGTSAFILQNTCILAMHTEVNIFMTYDLFESKNDVYITKDELMKGLQIIKRIAPWEYTRLTR